MRRRTAALALAAALVLAPGPAAAKLEIVASFSILGDMARQVAGGLAAVTTVVGPDADAHVYAPTVRDARAVARADAVLVNGLGFETWADALVEAAGGRAPVFVATAGIEPLRAGGAVDPHAWNSPPNGRVYIANIAAALAEVDPANAAAYRARAAAYSARLAALHERMLAAVAALPPGRRTVVTAHDAFGYLARAYGLEFLAPAGVDSLAEPSAAGLARLVDLVRARGAAALFVENVANPDLVRRIARETGLGVGGRLFSDALSRRGGPAPSYVAMLEHNFAALLAALRGPPPRSPAP